jgi:hypothetical protein
MFENTSTEMEQVLAAMREARDIEDLDMNTYEQEGFRTLYSQARRYMLAYERLAEESLEDQ